MGKGSNSTNKESSSKNDNEEQFKIFKWDEIRDNKKWIVIDQNVYDLSNFIKKHPGGSKILYNHIGQDASEAFYAFHKDFGRVNKYLNFIKIGKVYENNNKLSSIEENKDELIKDLKELKNLAEKMNLFKTNFLFFGLNFLQIIFLEFLAWLILYKIGFENWICYFVAVALMITGQAQAGWLQHDFGHLSVFRSSSMNHFMHKFIISTIKGVSGDWWNYRHFQHHAKPNKISFDPDIKFGTFLVLGKIIPKELGLQKKGKFPYNLQQYYFFMLLPPLLLPLYFNFENVFFLIKKKIKITESFWILSFLFRWYLMYVPVIGFFGSLKLYILMRFIESHWFVWATQMSHLPMDVDRDKEYSWFRSQLIATCNVEQSFFNDWWSGHLNFQIEHHLFPTMPRHNYYKIAPYVKSLCDKHKIEYQNKSLSKALGDIYYSLKDSGELWYEAYNM